MSRWCVLIYLNLEKQQSNQAVINSLFIRGLYACLLHMDEPQGHTVPLKRKVVRGKCCPGMSVLPLQCLLFPQPDLTGTRFLWGRERLMRLPLPSSFSRGPIPWVPPSLPQPIPAAPFPAFQVPSSPVPLTSFRSHWIDSELPQQCVCFTPLLLVGSSLLGLALLPVSLRESDALNPHTALVLRNTLPPPHSPLCAA